MSEYRPHQRDPQEVLRERAGELVRRLSGAADLHTVLHLVSTAPTAVVGAALDWIRAAPGHNAPVERVLQWRLNLSCLDERRLPMHGIDRDEVAVRVAAGDVSSQEVMRFIMQAEERIRPRRVYVDNLRRIVLVFPASEPEAATRGREIAQELTRGTRLTVEVR